MSDADRPEFSAPASGSAPQPGAGDWGSGQTRGGSGFPSVIKKVIYAPSRSTFPFPAPQGDAPNKRFGMSTAFLSRPAQNPDRSDSHPLPANGESRNPKASGGGQAGFSPAAGGRHAAAARTGAVLIASRPPSLAPAASGWMRRAPGPGLEGAPYRDPEGSPEGGTGRGGIRISLTLYGPFKIRRPGARAAGSLRKTRSKPEGCLAAARSETEGGIFSQS
jgi:hypothetical protein